jgi:hypothetical protein
MFVEQLPFEELLGELLPFKEMFVEQFLFEQLPFGEMLAVNEDDFSLLAVRAFSFLLKGKSQSWRMRKESFNKFFFYSSPVTTNLSRLFSSAQSTHFKNTFFCRCHLLSRNVRHVPKKNI